MASEKANPSPSNQSHQHISDPDSVFKGATRIQPSDFADGHYSAQDSISFIGDVDIWRVHLKSGDTLTASTDNGQDFNPDTYLALFDNKGNLLVTDDDSGGYYQSLLSFTAQSSGNYFVAVSAYGNLPTGGGGFQNGPEYTGGGYSLGAYSLNVDVV